MYSDAAALENSLIVPQMIGHKVTYDAILYLQSKEMELYIHTKNLYRNVQSSISHNGQLVGRIPMSIS